MKVIIAVCLFALLFIALFVDFHFGRKAHRAAVHKKSFPERHSDLELFTNGKTLTKQLFHDLQKAKRYIHIQFFIVKNDKISLQFSNLLKKKAEQGAEVRLLLDWVGSLSFPVNIRDDLKKSGVKFFYSSKPGWPFLFYSLQRRNHRNICVIDGETGYIGGFHIGIEDRKEYPPLKSRHGYHLRLTGEGVQDLESVFLDDWRQTSGEEILYKEIYINLQAKGPFRHRFILSDGAYLEEEYLALFQRAQKSIIIAMPYFIPTNQLLQELLSCLKRRISVNIIVPFHADHFLVKEAAYPSFRKLISAGAQIHQYQKGFFHGKYIMIDQAVAEIGTANFDKRSLFLNSEINCYINDNRFIEMMLKEIDNDIENCHLLSLSDLQNLGLWNHTKEWAAARLSYFL